MRETPKIARGLVMHGWKNIGYATISWDLHMKNFEFDINFVDASMPGTLRHFSPRAATGCLRGVDARRLLDTVSVRTLRWGNLHRL